MFGVVVGPCDATHTPRNTGLLVGGVGSVAGVA